MTVVVVDPSVATLWFANEPGSERCASLLSSEYVLAAPDLLLPETVNALWKKHRLGEIEAALVEQAVVNLLALDIDVIPSSELLMHAVRLAMSSKSPVYDCLYLALAQRRDASLATGDRRLARAARSLPDKPIPLWEG